MSVAWAGRLTAAMERQRASNHFRTRRVVRPTGPVTAEVDGRPVVNFASNDYLGLTHHPRVVAAFNRATSVGSGASPLVTGHTAEHDRAERAIAAWKGTDRAVLLGSGFAANSAAVAAVAAVGGGRVRFLVDKLAHASLVDAVRATGSFRVFPHNHLGKLERLLTDADPGQLQVIVTESVFSMDGDTAELAGIVELKRRFGAMLILDEAHGAGVYGPGGAGFAAELGLSAEVDLSVLTLSKGLGCVGGAIAASVDWCDAVVNFGRAYIYSTSLPAAVATAAVEAIGVISSAPSLRAGSTPTEPINGGDRQRRLRARATEVRARLTAAGFTMPAGDSPIVPVMLGDETVTLTTADQLLDRGLLVGAIRPPTVPRGGSRLRVTLSSEHTDEQVDQLVRCLRELSR